MRSKGETKLFGLGAFLLALSWSLFLTASAAQALPFQNGSFEEKTSGSPPTSGYVYLAGGSDVIKGWLVGGHSIDWVHKDYWASSDGNLSIDLNGLDAGSISQTFDTVPGTSYQVLFDMAGNPEHQNSHNTIKTKELKVAVASSPSADPFKEATFSFNIEGKTTDDMGWTEKAFYFTAAGDSTTLTFLSLLTNPGSNNKVYRHGPTIDNVRVNASVVPEPATVLLMGTGLAGLGLVRKRMRRA